MISKVYRVCRKTNLVLEEFAHVVFDESNILSKPNEDIVDDPCNRKIYRARRLISGDYRRKIRNLDNQ